MTNKEDSQPATKADLRKFAGVVDKYFTASDKKFTSINQRFDEVDKKFEKVDQRFDEVDKKFEKVDQRFDEVDKKFEKVDQRFDTIEKDIQDMKSDILNLRMDSKETKQVQVEMMKELKWIHNSLILLDEKVRYQKDLPERVEQLEQDVYDLKRKIHNKAHVP